MTQGWGLKGNPKSEKAVLRGRRREMPQNGVRKEMGTNANNPQRPLEEDKTV